MAVHVLLSRDEIRSILSLYHLDGLEEFGGIAEGSINTAYWVRASGRRYFLRITEKKRISDMVFEQLLLAHLGQRGFPVPSLIENVASGTFTPWSRRGRFVSLFQYMEGRDLGVFEIRPKHVRELGRLVARMHVSTQEFDRQRGNEFSIAALDRKVRRLIGALERGRLSNTYRADVSCLAGELERQQCRSFAKLPQGTVHGDLFIDNVKFKNGRIAGVIDFEMASTERLIWDVAVAINAWCWQPSADQAGGPSGSFSVARTRALIGGYDAVRRLTDTEKAALPHELRLAAARFGVSRMVDFELSRLPTERRVYKDYRHFMERLRSLQRCGAERLVRSACMISQHA